MLRILLSVFVLQFALLINATGLYSVVGPGTIRSNFKYNVAVSVHKADGPSQLRISLNGPSYNETKEIEVLPMSTQNVEFDVPKLAAGDYNLTAVGVSGIVFENSTKLNRADDKPSTFIQTDKATYKPADLVQFRVLILDEQTRPAKLDKPVTIAITDGAQNRIKQLTDIKLTKGVYAGELQLSEQPVLGTWQIAVSVDGDGTETKTFEVDKYVLPKFEVIIESPKDVAVQEKVIKATIRAKYTYGKPVKGKATVSIEPNYAHYLNRDVGRQEKTIDVDGKGHVEFSIEGTQYRGGYAPPLKILAIVTEELTGNRQNATTIVNLHSQRYSIQGVDTPPSYQPGKAFAFQVVVKNVDGSPVRDAEQKVKVSFVSGHRFSAGGTQREFNFESTLNEHGMATFNVTLPELEMSYVSINAVFGDSSSFVGSISKFQPALDSSEPLKIELKNKQPKLGESVAFDVKSNSDIPYFVYTIVARGNIVDTDYVDVPKGRRTHTVKFTPSFAMVPRAIIYVHYIYDNELRFEEKQIDFEKDFSNSIEISAPVDAKPGEEVQLRVKTDADSFVGLLGVDQSVLLLKSGNDLSRDEIFNSLSKYQTATPWQRGYGRYPGETSGLVTLTNANYPYNTAPVSVEHSDSYMTDNIEYDVEEQVDDDIDTVDGPTEAKKLPDQVRKNFADLWIWQTQTTGNGSTDADGFTLAKKIPDTITSWVVTGFSLNPSTGIALTKRPSKIRVFQPFFVSTNLPYSVKRGEVIAIPVIVFNYLDKTLDAEVAMDNADKEYEFTEATNEVQELASDEVRRVKRVTIPANSGRSVSFMIRPKRVGATTLKISATSPIAGDTIHQKLKVEPEGVTQFVNRALFINLKDQAELSEALAVQIPAEAVPDSEFIEFSVVGDLLGPTLQNLDNLVRMPYGCGEQNMVNFVPNILVLTYLEVTSRPMAGIEAKAKKFLEIGYQRELTYKHDDGSYSAFGKSDPSGSTWLTAYVMRSFHQAAKYTQVDPKVLTAGLDFLASKQRETGEFPELGKLFDSANQNELALTAFVLLAFFENQELIPKYQSAVDKGVRYVAEQVDQTEDQYALAIAAVALQLAQHPQAEKVLAKLEGEAHQENDRKWWSKAAEQPTPSTVWRPRSNDVELTAYVLIALLEQSPAETSLPIVKWLIGQRNSNGGFASTQDTVVGLQALTKFAQKTGSGTGTMAIDFVPSNGTRSTIKVQPANALVLQTHVLPRSTRQVEFTARGTGSAMVQLSYRYNLAEKDKRPSFKVTPTVKDSASNRLLVLDICAEYVPLEAGDQDKDSNMAVMEIALPSGYVGDADSLGRIESVDRVKRVETKNSDSTVIVYFDSLTPGDVKCLPVEATKAHAVAKQKPAAVSLYDYYDTERRATEYYQVKSSLCDICEGTDCGTGCNK
ncbi:CD109 antigen isoform X1 [Drosophila obscura]|uniref:CD109 antigen isoform X1 n=1 Tax=Drosophila obscura TaxID=7282 RepID=UPI001BB125E3|nr:CD109 antigen isoform X1 [Drosophila obscura]